MRPTLAGFSLQASGSEFCRSVNLLYLRLPEMRTPKFSSPSLPLLLFRATRSSVGLLSSTVGTGGLGEIGSPAWKPTPGNILSEDHISSHTDPVANMDRALRGGGG